MPRTRLSMRQPPHAELGQLISGAAFMRKVTLEDLGRTIDKTPKTVRARLRSPGDLTIDEAVRLCRKLGIPIEEFRNAIRY